MNQVICRQQITTHDLEVFRQNSAVWSFGRCVLAARRLNSKMSKSSALLDLSGTGACQRRGDDCDLPTSADARLAERCAVRLGGSSNATLCIGTAPKRGSRFPSGTTLEARVFRARWHEVSWLAGDTSLDDLDYTEQPIV